MTCMRLYTEQKTNEKHSMSNQTGWQMMMFSRRDNYTRIELFLKHADMNNAIKI